MIIDWNRAAVSSIKNITVTVVSAMPMAESYPCSRGSRVESRRASSAEDSKYIQAVLIMTPDPTYFVMKIYLKNRTTTARCRARMMGTKEPNREQMRIVKMEAILRF